MPETVQQKGGITLPEGTWAIAILPDGQWQVVMPPWPDDSDVPELAMAVMGAGLRLERDLEFRRHCARWFQELPRS